MGKQKKSFIDTENEVAVQRACKYIGSFAINMMKAEERQIMMNERLEELKNVKKGIRVVLHVTTFGIKVFDEKETNVKMAHAIMRVAFSTCCPDTRMFSYVAKSLKSSKNPSILQAHVFKTKKAAHAQQLSAVMSKAFRIAFSMATVKRKNNLEAFDVSASEAQQMVSPIEVKRRWAKKEMAKGHDLSEHAERARTKNPLARLPGKSEPIDQEIFANQPGPPVLRERNVSNADFDNSQMLQRGQLMRPSNEIVNVQVNNQANPNLIHQTQGMPPTQFLSPHSSHHYPGHAPNAVPSGQQFVSGYGQGMPPPNQHQQLAMPPNAAPGQQWISGYGQGIPVAAPTQQQQLAMPPNAAPGQQWISSYGQGMPVAAPNQHQQIGMRPNVAAADQTNNTVAPGQQLVSGSGLGMPSAAPNHTQQLSVPINAVSMMQSIAVTENQGEQTERVNQDAQTDDDSPAGEELYQNMNVSNSQVHLANERDVEALEDLYVNKEIINESLLSNKSNDSTSNGSTGQPELLQQNACIALPEPDYGPVENDEPKCDVSMMQSEGASCLQNPSSVNKEKEDEDDREDVYLTRDIMKEQYRQSTTEMDLLKDSYWFQPGLPREIAEEVLAQERPGSFFIRESTSTPGCYAMSLRVPDGIKESGIANILIQNTATGEYQIPGFRQSFSSIPMLVAFYASFQDELPVKLLLSYENKLILGEQDAVDGCTSPEEAIALIDAVLPSDPDFMKYDSCDEIQQELDNLSSD
ncbi:uncharacterized protein LOC135687995 [Rhopilema esculentum]|uniref:uncharacterized protein LOC135687995 n=1 Tax=Rhopilema esculentum TaxID=499914 RepID=UPI0031DADC05